MAVQADHQIGQILLDFFDKIQSSSSTSNNGSPADPKIHEIASVKDLITRNEFWSLIHLYSTIISQQKLKETKTPASSESVNLAVELIETLRPLAPKLPEVKELLHLILLPHFQALLQAHDSVAQGQYEPVLPDIPHEVDEDEGYAVKIVKLVKNNEPLGATIKLDDSSGAVLIARVIHGGVADRSGCISVGDRVLEVNDIPVTGKCPAEVVKILGASGASVTFKLIPCDDPARSQSSEPPKGTKHRFRALFNYNPKEDPYIPCPDAGLAFKRGDVLHLVSTDDPHWWQARIEYPAGAEGTPTRNGILTSTSTNTHQKIGLVPSSQLREKLQAMRTHATTPKSSDSESSPASRKCYALNNGTHGKRVKKVLYDTASSGDLGLAGESSYEEVSRFYPRSDFCRPIVLIGPPGVGRNELKRRLLMLNPNRYGTTIPHTSRPRRTGEVEGIEYHYVSRDRMEQWIHEGKFLEYGEYKGNFYGTLLESVKAIIRQQRICVINPHPQALVRLRTSEIKPYIIFVKPPPFSLLKETRCVSRARATSSSPGSTRMFSDDELHAMIESGKRLTQRYGHVFDHVLENGHIDSSFQELCNVAIRLETEAQWIPSSWL